MPIFTAKGSMILWLSSTLHSAKIQSRPGTLRLGSGPWTDWRMVVYGTSCRACVVPEVSCRTCMPAVSPAVSPASSAVT